MAIQACSQFKCTRGKHSSFFLHKHWDSDPAATDIIQEAKEKNSNAGTADAISQLSQLPRISDTDSTCRVWTQFDALAHVRYYLAIRGGDWEKYIHCSLKPLWW